MLQLGADPSLPYENLAAYGHSCISNDAVIGENEQILDLVCQNGADLSQIGLISTFFDDSAFYGNAVAAATKFGKDKILKKLFENYGQTLDSNACTKFSMPNG